MATLTFEKSNIIKISLKICEECPFIVCGPCHKQNEGRYLGSLNEGIKLVGLAKTARFEQSIGPTVGLSGLDLVQ